MSAQYRAPKGLKTRVLFDAWHANPTVMKAIEQRGFHAVGVLHCNRKIVVDGKEYRADEYALMQLKYFEPKVFTPRGTTGAVDALDVICHVKTLGIFNYDLGVSLGQHEPKEWIGETGVAIALGFNIGDIVQEVFCVLAIIGLFRRKLYGWVASICELAISIYWPLTFSGYYFFASNIAAFQMPNSAVVSHIVIFVVWILIGIICICHLVKNRHKFVDKF